jgi:RimJ/RimL family protein N-acetyltransferase
MVRMVPLPCKCRGGISLGANAMTFSPTAPVLETERLRLRPFRATDLDPQQAAMTDPEVYRFLGGAPAAREETWRKILGSPGLWALLGYGYWAAERREDGAYLGQIGFADFKRGMTPSIENIPEMGWIMTREAQGRGYATEAVLAALAWADEALGGGEIVAIISHENAASIRIAEKGGFARREEAVYKGEPILLFRRPPR